MLLRRFSPDRPAADSTGRPRWRCSRTQSRPCRRWTIWPPLH